MAEDCRSVCGRALQPYVAPGFLYSILHHLDAGFPRQFILEGRTKSSGNTALVAFSIWLDAACAIHLTSWASQLRLTMPSRALPTFAG